MSGTRVSTAAWILVVLVAFGLPLYLGLGRVDLENDEALHSLVAESILQVGDWMTPRALTPILNDAFTEKPPLKFWLVAAPMRLGLVPDNEAGLRLWDATFGVCIFLYVFGLGRLIAGRWCGFISCLVLFTFDPLVFQHGLRTNNMDAALVLAYCGGMYHYMRWTREPVDRRRDLHALAVGLFCLLGFMTKFVAVAFLPIVIVLVSLAHRDVRARLVREWKTWALVTAVAICLASPWFVYQTFHMGAEFWNVILLDHVFRRFSTGLDPAHLKPWNFYVFMLFQALIAARTFWLVAVGVLLALWRSVRREWFEGSLILAWFAVPLFLISCGSSKLLHYVYPFVPPLALAAGLLFAWLDRGVAELMDRRRATPAVAWAARVAIALVLIADGPADAYRATFPKLLVENHPLRAARDCMQNVREFQRRDGLQPTSLFVYLPPGIYQHPYFYYFRNVGWDLHQAWNDDALTAALDLPGEQQAVLMPRRDYLAFAFRNHRWIGSVPKADVLDAVLLLPGPFAGCGTH